MYGGMYGDGDDFGGMYGDDQDRIDREVSDTLTLDKILSVGLMPIKHKLRTYIVGCLLRDTKRKKAISALEDAARKEELVPVEVQALSAVRVVAVAAGDYHSMAVTDQGKLFTWGAGEDGRAQDPQSSFLCLGWRMRLRGCQQASRTGPKAHP